MGLIGTTILGNHQLIALGPDEYLKHLGTYLMSLLSYLDLV